MSMSKRRFIQALGAATAVTAMGASVAATRNRRYDLLVIGAGTAGIPAAIFAAARGASVLVIDAAATIGGTLLLTSGQMSAAGTRVQKQQGIDDTPELFFQDLIRISRGTVDQPIARLAVDNAATTFDWLMDNGYPLLPGYPVEGVAHEPYSKPRYYWSDFRAVSAFSMRCGRSSLRLSMPARWICCSSTVRWNCAPMQPAASPRW